MTDEIEVFQFPSGPYTTSIRAFAEIKGKRKLISQAIVMAGKQDVKVATWLRSTLSEADLDRVISSLSAMRNAIAEIMESPKRR